MLDPIYNELADKVAKEYPVRSLLLLSLSLSVTSSRLFLSNKVSLGLPKSIVIQKVKSIATRATR